MNYPGHRPDFQNSAWRLKINRASTLRTELESIFKDYQATSPIEVIDSDWDGSTLSVSLSVQRAPEAHWGTIVGDIVHNYHSTLDSIYFELISHFASKSQKAFKKWDQEHISFPIFDTLEGFNSNTTQIKKYKAGAILQDLLSYQPFEYINEFVEEHQVQTVLSGHLLKILRELSNLDKHRALHVIHFYLYTHAIGLPAGVRLISGSNPSYFPGQTEYSLSFKFEGATIQSKPHFLPEFKLGIISGFGSPYSNDIENLLRAIEGKILFIIHQLEYHFH